MSTVNGRVMHADEFSQHPRRCSSFKACRNALNPPFGPGDRRMDNEIKYVLLGSNIIIDTADAHIEGFGQFAHVGLMITFLNKYLCGLVDYFLALGIDQVFVAAVCPNAVLFTCASQFARSLRNVDETL